ncbi:LacI family DNA-binding transcriptional regulator [Microbacterium stercoris]|uniref:LacI family DNA-binding transcriptional regulator n=1 Tax=Microbacterium stercoris TaxID=2820289 RepID=A0A939TPR1_9MICO|nr:LacI family DNA-binding transcriptional regulator [Microbacterium stercoris]MBO3662670.1 LacI family DNA-binding transcriptional regulator [Microbacterium stercoris]
MSMPTSRDVARLAGVSQTTVSYVLNGRGNVSDATRERVLGIAAEIGYRPNQAARSMRTRRSGRIAVIMGAGIESHMQLLAGASEVAQQAGYAAESHHIDGTPDDRGERVLDLAASGQYEGILTIAPVPDELAAPVGSDCVIVPAATFDAELHSMGPLADATLIGTFVETLAAAGHRTFVHIAGPDDYVSARARAAAYTEAVERLGLRSLGLIGGSWGAETGRRAILDLPAQDETIAVIAGNDDLAIGVLRGAAERGWSLPDDLVVTGWDNHEFGAYTTPAITTVAMDFREAGRRAMRRLVAALGHTTPPPEEQGLMRIVWRESTGELPTAG